jgi:hypothetical protein
MKPRWLGKCATAAQLVFLLTLLAWGWVLSLFCLAAMLSGVAAIDYVVAFSSIPSSGETG